jgi:hypothetical protein
MPIATMGGIMAPGDVGHGNGERRHISLGGHQLAL